jgi:hypothetical protein
MGRIAARARDCLFLALSYLESFDTPAGDPLTTAYTDWSVTEGASNDTQIVSAGQLEMFLSVSAVQPQLTVASIAASTLVGASAFDVAQFPLAVSGDVGGSADASQILEYQVALVVGDYAFVFHPGASAGGIHRVERLSEDSVVRGNKDMGFTPLNDGTTYPISVSVIQSGSDYVFNYSIGTFTAAPLTVPVSSGALDQVGFRVGGTATGTGTGFYDDLAVSQIREPTSFALLILGLGGLALWRRRG